MRHSSVSTGILGLYILSDLYLNQVVHLYSDFERKVSFRRNVQSSNRNLPEAIGFTTEGYTIRVSR